MAVFIALMRFTDSGIENIKDTVSRAKQFEAQAESLNIKVKKIWWTVGPYDGLVSFEAADDETATAALLSLSSHGFVRTQTLRAFDSEQMTEIISRAD